MLRWIRVPGADEAGKGAGPGDDRGELDRFVDPMDVVGDRSVAEGGHLEVVQVDARVGRAGQRLRTRPRPVPGLVRSRHALGQPMVDSERIAAGLEPGFADPPGNVAEPGPTLAPG